MCATSGTHLSLIEMSTEPNLGEGQFIIIPSIETAMGGIVIYQTVSSSLSEKSVFFFNGTQINTDFTQF